MGQYYRPILIDDKRNVKVYNRQIEGSYTLAKLMEHSWWGNEFVGTICKKIFGNPHRIVWVGDYADDADPINGIEQNDLIFPHIPID